MCSYATFSTVYFFHNKFYVLLQKFNLLVLVLFVHSTFVREFHVPYARINITS